jgi:hypothetical protein
MADQATTATVFGETDQSTTTKSTTTNDQGDNPVSILVGEGRKYKTVEDLAKAYINLDGFTEKLKGENAQFREQLAGAKTIDDVIERLSQSKASTTDQGEAKPSPGITADAIAKIVKDTVTGLETARTRQDNLTKADAAMKKLYGDKAQEVFSKAADTPEKRRALQNLAEVDPTQFVRLFQTTDGSHSQGTQTDSGSTINTAALADVSQSARVGDPTAKEFYDTLRQKDPRKFYSQEVQLAMHKAAVANPEKFFGRKNWND